MIIYFLHSITSNTVLILFARPIGLNFADFLLDLGKLDEEAEKMG